MIYVSSQLLYPVDVLCIKWRVAEIHTRCATLAHWLARISRKTNSLTLGFQRIYMHTFDVLLYSASRSECIRSRKCFEVHGRLHFTSGNTCWKIRLCLSISHFLTLYRDMFSRRRDFDHFSKGSKIQHVLIEIVGSPIAGMVSVVLLSNLLCWSLWSLDAWCRQAFFFPNPT